MSDLNKIFRKIKLQNLMAFLIYGTDSDGEVIDDYERKIDESYDKLFAELERIYPELSRDDNELFNIIEDFAATHDRVYFETGVLTGFQLFKNLENEYKENSWKKMNVEFFRKFMQDGADRAEEADEVVSHDGAESAKPSEELNKRPCNLDKDKFTPAQWTMIEDILFMKTERGAEYGKSAYHQGFSDALKFMRDIFKTM